MPATLPYGSRAGVVGYGPDQDLNPIPMFGIMEGPSAQDRQVDRDIYNQSFMDPYRTALAKQQYGDAGFKSMQARQAWGALFPQLTKALGNSSNASFNFNKNPFSVPAPSYMPNTPIWNQGQIDAQANLQRANLQQEAATQAHRQQQNFANTGFSPVASPFLNYAQQNALLKANAAAAANETNLNFNAAKSNKDAQIASAQVNANLYGNWLDALVGSQQTNVNAQLQSQRQNQDWLMNLFNLTKGLI